MKKAKKPKRKHLGAVMRFRCTDDTKAVIEQAAVDDDLSVSRFCTRAALHYAEFRRRQRAAEHQGADGRLTA